MSPIQRSPPRSFSKQCEPAPNSPQYTGTLYFSENAVFSATLVFQIVPIQHFHRIHIPHVHAGTDNRVSILGVHLKITACLIAVSCRGTEISCTGVGIVGSAGEHQTALCQMSLGRSVVLSAGVVAGPEVQQGRAVKVVGVYGLDKAAVLVVFVQPQFICPGVAVVPDVLCLKYQTN